MISVVGKGSYGCVSKARCRTSGVLVAVKVMENQAETEYDTIKILREVQIMNRMNEICEQVGSKKIVGSFIPQLVDLICLTGERG